MSIQLKRLGCPCKREHSLNLRALFVSGDEYSKILLMAELIDVTSAMKSCMNKSGFSRVSALFRYVSNYNKRLYLSLCDFC